MYSFNLFGIEVFSYQKGIALGYKDNQFIRCIYNKKEYGFYRHSDSEWKYFSGIMLSEEKTLDKGVMISEIVEGDETEETKKISFAFGGGKWILSHERGSFLNFSSATTQNIYLDINKFINSKFLSDARRHTSGIFYFTKSKKDYNLLKFEDLLLTSHSQLEKSITNKKFEKFKSIVQYIKDVKNIGMKDRRLVIFFIQEKGYLDYLEFLFQINPGLTLLLDFYTESKNRELLTRYKIIYYYINNQFKFDFFLKENIKFLKNQYLGRIMKIIDKKEVFVDIGLIDILLISDLNYVNEVIKLNKKIFKSDSAKKVIRQKRNVSNKAVANHLLKYH